MMELYLRDNLPFTQVRVVYQGATIEISDVLVDTGSASTILAADVVAAIQLTPLPDDSLYTIRGVGGVEVVFTRQVDYLQLGEQRISDFEIEIGGLDYGFEIKGILGMDFLMQIGAIINLREMEIGFAD
jgi:hypothetical protein